MNAMILRLECLTNLHVGNGDVNYNIIDNEVERDPVPHESAFFFPVLADKLDRDFLRDFREAVDGKIVQFGGNASIGYGLCKVTVMGGREDE